MTSYSLNTIDVLWRRDLTRFLRQPTRIIGALGQPVLFWLILGSGLSATFRLPSEGAAQVGYMEFFFPGVVAMVLLFASIFASVSVIEDRHQGFLQALLAGPGSRTAIVLGKCAGAATVALFQAGLFVVLAPLAGFSYLAIQWPLLLLTMACLSLGLTALGFAMAWLIDSVQGYHAIQMTLLVPLWVISGAMFPPSGPLAAFMWLNPVAYGVSALRQALYGGAAPEGTALLASGFGAFAVVLAFAGVSVSLAAYVCERARVQTR